MAARRPAWLVCSPPRPTLWLLQVIGISKSTPEKRAEFIEKEVTRLLCAMQHP